MQSRQIEGGPPSKEASFHPSLLPSFPPSLLPPFPPSPLPFFPPSLLLPFPSFLLPPFPPSPRPPFPPFPLPPFPPSPLPSISQTRPPSPCTACASLHFLRLLAPGLSWQLRSHLSPHCPVPPGRQDLSLSCAAAVTSAAARAQPPAKCGHRCGVSGLDTCEVCVGG